jgi:heme-degrading monooxygenase HmoA
MAYFVAIWQFDIHPSLRSAFERAYGSDGEWAALFRRSPDYVRTDLLRDPAQPDRYLTLDYWQTQAAWVAFHSAYRVEYDALDARYSQFTTSEVHIGSFVSVG